MKNCVGHSELKRALTTAVDNGRVSHAQLFSGATGKGSLALAVGYAKYLNCTNRTDGDSCGVCGSCVKMGALQHPDLHFVYPVNRPKGGTSGKRWLSDDFASEWRELVVASGGYLDESDWQKKIEIESARGAISVHEAHEIIKKMSFKAFDSGYKIMVIWLPERMNVEASNALLKLIEEPWERSLFLLVSESPEQLLPTIISRTQEVAVPGIDRESMVAHLVRTHNLPREQAEQLAQISGGDIVKANRAITQGGEQRGFFELFKDLMRLSYSGRHMELLDWGDRVAAMGRDEQIRFLNYAVVMFRENYMLNAGMGDITRLWGEELEFGRKFSPFIANHNIEGLVREFETAILHVHRNGNGKLIFPHMALQLSKMITRI